MIVPFNTLGTMYVLNSNGVPCYVHSSDNTIPTEPITERFDNYTKPEDYQKSGVKYIVPMTAKEIEEKEEQLSTLSDSNFFVEEKFDGTRGILHFYKVPDFKEAYPDWLKDDTLYFYACLLRGSSIVDSKRRIFDFIHNHWESSCVEFIKREYGIGGSYSKPLNYDFNTKGFTISPPDRPKKTYSWNDVQNGIKKLISDGFYYPQDAYARVFSRRQSVETGWLSENTDRVPQLRDLNIPELEGTIIDGEMFIPNQPFKAVSSTLNCNSEKAIARQIELGGIVFHAFDILYFKGIDLRRMPLYRRKVYLEIVCRAVNSRFVKCVDYYDTDGIPVKPLTIQKQDEVLKNAELYPNLVEDVKKYITLLNTTKDTKNPNSMLVSKKSYYEYIVLTGGEGVILKPKNGKYYHKRTKEYLKIKKFLTRECIITGFTHPTREYKGKFPDDSWEYWEDPISGEKLDRYSCLTTSAKSLLKRGYVPVTKYHYEDWIGNIEYGVLITDEEIAKLPKNKKHTIRDLTVRTDFNDYLFLKVLIVGECSGFTEEERAILTKHREALVGAVVEIKANEIFRDTGKLRHPRFLRLRPDKSPLECTFENHIQ